MSDNTVTTKRKEYTEGLCDITRNRDAVKGERAIKAKRELYLPPIPSMCTTTEYVNGQQSITAGSFVTSEGQSAYNKYLSLAQYFGATGRTVDGLVGLIFSKKPVSELPSKIEYMKTNCDSKGTSLRDFSKSICVESMVSNRSGVLVARPETPQGASKKDVELKNLRPKLLHYKYESIINWDYEVVNNELKLSLVVLCEEVTKRKGFEVKTVKQYRVLELIEGVYNQSVYNDKEEVIEIASPVIINGNTSPAIPFYFVKTGVEDKALINDLADTNIHHYQVSADYYSKLYFSSFTIYYETNVQNGASNNMVIGNGVKWNGGPDSQFGILQPDGNADCHRLALEDIKSDMASLGAQQLQPKTSMAESAEAKSLDKVAQNSTTADVAITVSEVLTKALTFAAMWMGDKQEAIYKLNTDYNPTGMGAQELTARWNVYLGGGMTFDEFHRGMQTGEVITTDQTSEEAKTTIDAEQQGMNGSV